MTFFSRSRQTLWTKGETSGNHLQVTEISADCDADTILIKANPAGPVCHTGADTCFNETNENENYLFELEKVIHDRKTAPAENSYTSKLFQKGINKIAQKVGEEAVELVIEAKDDDAELFTNEAADLMYHFLILLAAKTMSPKDVLTTLKERNNQTGAFLDLSLLFSFQLHALRFVNHDRLVFDLDIACVQTVGGVFADAEPVAQEIIRSHYEILLERQIVFVA